MWGVGLSNKSNLDSFYDEHCCRCKKLCSNALSVCLSGEGPEKASIMLVGEAPDDTEDRLDRPFVGKSGKFLVRHMLRGSGLDREDLFLTNAVRCRSENNKTPTITHIRNCRSYLEDEVAAVKPRVIVLLGNVALHSVIPLKAKAPPQNASAKKESAVSGITKWRGKAIWHSEFNCWVVPTFRPSGLMQKFKSGSRFDLDLAIRDLELATRLVKKAPPKRSTPKIYFADTKEKAIKVLKEVQKSAGNIVSFDIETTGLDSSSLFVGFSLSDVEGRGFFVDADLLRDKRVDSLFRKFLVIVLIKRVYIIMRLVRDFWEWRGMGLGRVRDF